jgi:SAM-dependent methyltransferase
MKNFYSKNYWSIGFNSKLYDLLSPESYFESIRRVVDNIPDEKALNLLDAGCGSGLLLKFLSGRIREGMYYTGIDLLRTGVEKTLLRAKKLGITSQVSCFQYDLTSPLIEKKFDVIVAHFSIYTISSREQRLKGLVKLKSLMKPQGTLILVNPSIKYNIDSIIKESIRLVRDRYGLIASLIRQVLIYPFTKILGLTFIQRQLRAREWKAYTRDEFLCEMREVGFLVQHIEGLYAGCAYLAIGKISA